MNGVLFGRPHYHAPCSGRWNADRVIVLIGMHALETVRVGVSFACFTGDGSNDMYAGTIFFLAQ